MAAPGVPQGRRVRYELAHERLAGGLRALVDVVLSIGPSRRHGRWHIRVRGAMHAAGLRQRDPREGWGQLVCSVVAGPGSITRRYLLGNTGWARVPTMQPMPIPHDLAELLDNARR